MIHYPPDIVDKLQPQHSFLDWLYSPAGATVCAAVVAAAAIYYTRKNTRDQIAHQRHAEALKARRDALVAADEARQEQYEAVRNLVDSRVRTGISPDADLLAYNEAERASRRAQYKLKLFGYDETVVDKYEAVRKAARVIRDDNIADTASDEWVGYKAAAGEMNKQLSWLVKNLEQDGPVPDAVG
ncbi:hypothetical protein FR943_02475 [Mycobacterium sp. TNTM28]|uniref:Uncharacterized protein n=1 Tax=[Mycobacterium] fortunisiensis TaxID=2600579 RepID=A0ABS6KGM3_9MYCO|nr:hypothetical protein [[Mycobacterium] fortunisiensis]MBU9762719.1 hypothetical protein [[Mycobacterium] fortunisiensis]